MDSIEIQQCLREAIEYACEKCPAYGFENCKVVVCKPKRWRTALLRAMGKEASK